MITVKEVEEAPTIVNDEDDKQPHCIAQQREARKRLRTRIRKSKKK